MSKDLLIRRQRLITEIGKDVSLMLDAHSEASNNLVRREDDFLIQNLRTCFDLAKRVERRRKKVNQLFREGYR